MKAPTTAATSVVVLADDLIWSSRLRAATEQAGANPHAVQSIAQLNAAIAATAEETPVIVDLNGRAYDGVAGVALAAEEGHPVVAVGPHEDLDLRKRALGAGAIRVFSYNKLFTDGPAVVKKLIEGEL